MQLSLNMSTGLYIGRDGEAAWLSLLQWHTTCTSRFKIAACLEGGEEPLQLLAVPCPRPKPLQLLLQLV